MSFDFYSKEMQDVFALMLNGQKGSFIDIGCNHPITGNNTYALEKRARWRGVLCDIRTRWTNLCNLSGIRDSPAFCVDAADRQFIEILNHEFKDKCPDKLVDFVSLDADDGTTGALENLLIGGYSFKCMTIEHDAYQYGDTIRAPTRKLLENYGYHLLFGDVLLDSGESWEDWWIKPDEYIDSVISLTNAYTRYEKCIESLVELSNNAVTPNGLQKQKEETEKE